ncbi:MAG: hypothetical protein EAZ91_10930 [Cytophagales bacterium]|nr:MAG: hypothetical protein EAZ91_10930 [Cytophagales bacterium]
MLVITVCTVRQLPQAFALGNTIRHHPNAQFQIGLADELPSAITSPFPYALLPVAEVLDAGQLSELSARYTPTEFVAAVKPTLIRAIMARQTGVESVLYFDPNTVVYESLTPVPDALRTANALLTPHLVAPPADACFPDEKYLQNVGLYSSDFIALRPGPETDRMLAWWEDRVQTRAQVDFCESLCLDQLWLMHWPALFDGVRVVQDRSWHRAIWNWHEWPTNAPKSPLWINFKGLFNPDEGLFAYQNRTLLARRPDLARLLEAYRQTVANYTNAVFSQLPAFGKQPEPPIVRGWRRKTGLFLRSMTRFVDTVQLPTVK